MADAFVQIHKCWTTEMLLKILTDDNNNILTSDTLTFKAMAHHRINARIYTNWTNEIENLPLNSLQTTRSNGPIQSVWEEKQDEKNFSKKF